MSSQNYLNQPGDLMKVPGYLGACGGMRPYECGAQGTPPERSPQEQQHDRLMLGAQMNWGSQS